MAFNALMPGEHDWMKNARMSSSATPGYTPPQDDFASLMVSLGGSPLRAPKPAPAQAPQKKNRPILNALGTYLQFAAPEQYEAGRTARMNRDYQNALAGGDMEKAAQYRLQMGDFEGAKQIQDYTAGQSAEARKQEAQGVYQLFTSMQPAQINDYAMQDPAGFERMTGMTSEEYLASAQQMQQVGMTPEQFHQYVIGKAQAELGMEAQTAEYMAPIEGVDANGNPVYYQPSKTGQGRRIEDVMPVKQEADYASAADATGVRRYTEGPNIGQPVPGFETPRPERGGMQVSVDENGNPVIVFGAPGQGSAFGKSGDSLGSKVFGDALDQSGTADNTLAMFNRAERILSGGYNTGALADIKGRTGAIANDLGITIPGFSSGRAVADYEEFSSINKQLAAQMLKLFGGSDTERELAISISSNIGPGMGDETNRRMIEAGKQIIERQRSKPEFIAQWTRRYGSLDAINPETGLGFQATWDRFLQDEMASMTGAASDTRQVAVEGAAQSWTPDKEARLKEIEAILKGGQ